MKIEVYRVEMDVIRGHLERAEALLNSCALVQTEKATYAGITDAIVEVRAAKRATVPEPAFPLVEALALFAGASTVHQEGLA